jgi:hypothetical protein
MRGTRGPTLQTTRATLNGHAINDATSLHAEAEHHSRETWKEERLLAHVVKGSAHTCGATLWLITE